MGELNPVIAEAILGGQQSIGVNALISLQQNSRKLGKSISEELDKELSDFGLGTADVNILSINYPDDLQEMAERVAAQSFVGHVGKYAAVQMADSFDNPGGDSNIASMGAQLAMGAQMAQQMAGTMAGISQPLSSVANLICTGCGLTSATSAKFCPECGKPMKAAGAEPAASAGQFCPACRKMVAGKFCPDCGTQTV
jgi:membrane protease subunit (stomatin/prohibitin family)